MTDEPPREWTIEECLQLLRDTDPESIRSHAERETDLRLRKALNLALDLETFEALLRGETLPLSKLDPIWVRRYGIRAAG